METELRVLPPLEPRPGEASPRGTRFGPFVLDSRLAVGGTAEVYLAHPADPKSDLPKSLVVKRLLPTFAADPEGRQMFDREAKLHAQVHHENVVRVFGAGSSEKDEPYLAMEYVPGVDGYRVVRKLRLENRAVPTGVAVHIASEVLRALAAVHSATCPNHTPLGIVHRDVSPSNVYLARNGAVKLGDFGIARSLTRRTLSTDPNQGVKGKFAYLAPEQVAGDPSDHRADLFSLGNVLAEMLLGQPVFPGNGQLAVLLAIRDGKTEAIETLSATVDAGLVEVIRIALSRDPQKRYSDATAFLQALEPYQIDLEHAKSEISALVRATEAASSTASLNAVRASVSAMRAVRPSGTTRAVSSDSILAAVVAPILPTPVPPSTPRASEQAALEFETAEFDKSDLERATAVSSLPPHSKPTGEHTLDLGLLSALDDDDDDDDQTNRFNPEDLHLIDESRRTSAPPPPHKSKGTPTTPPGVKAARATLEVELLPSFVHTTDGRRLGPFSFSKLVEDISSGDVHRDAKVDYMGRGVVPLAEIPELARLLPPLTPPPPTSTAMAPEPQFSATLYETSLYEVVLRIFLQADSGLLMVDGPNGKQKQLYIDERRLQYVSSNDTSELFGEMLVQWGKLERYELDMALAVLPKFHGRLGDTLIGLGLVEAMDVFHAIREQGRDRVGDMFNWKEGNVRFFPDAPKPDFEFALELPLTDVILRGLELSVTREALIKKHKPKWNMALSALEETDPEMFQTNVWPPAFPHVIGFINGTATLGQVVEAAQVPDELDGADVLRIIDVLLAVNAVWWAY